MSQVSPNGQEHLEPRVIVNGLTYRVLGWIVYRLYEDCCDYEVTKGIFSSRAVAEKELARLNGQCEDRPNEYGYMCSCNERPWHNYCIDEWELK